MSYRLIVKMLWPLALGMINNAVMQFVDRAYLAHDSMISLEASLPACALAGVFVGFFQSVVGFSGVLVSQYYGAKDEGGCLRSCRAGLWIALASGLMMFPFLPIGWWILSLASPSAALFASERSYYDVVVVGSVFLFGQMAVSSYFTGRGRTKLVFWVNLLGNLLNVALDPLLIFTLGWGIRGAACATVLSQLMQFAVLMSMAWKDGLWRGGILPDAAIVKQILRFGIPAGGYEVLNMLSFTIFVFVTETVGGVEFAVSNVCFTICYLLFAPMTGFALGAQTLVGQFRGRGDNEGAITVARRTLLLGLAFCVVSVGGVLLFNRQVLGLFAPSDAADSVQFMSLGFEMIVLMAIWMVFDAIDTIVSGALKGAGDTRFVFWWMMFSAFGVWLPLVFLVKCLHGTMPLLWSTMIVYVVVISLGSYIRWRLGRWKTIKVVA